MPIQIRYAPDLEQETETLLEVLKQVQGTPGAQGLQGPPGEDGEDGEDAVTKPPRYIANPTTTVTLSAAQGTAFRIRLDDDIELKFAGFKDGQKFSVAVTQDGGGFTITWPAGIKWVGGVAPTLTTTDGKRDVFGFERWKGGGEDGYDGFVIGQNI